MKSNLTELLSKIPQRLVHLFDFLPPIQSSNFPPVSKSAKVPFCCRGCKKLLEKRQRLEDSIAKVETDICRRRNNVSGTNTSTRSLSVPVQSSPTRVLVLENVLKCDLSPIAVRRTSNTKTSSVGERPAKPKQEFGVQVKVCAS